MSMFELAKAAVYAHVAAAWSKACSDVSSTQWPLALDRTAHNAVPTAIWGRVRLLEAACSQDGFTPGGKAYRSEGMLKIEIVAPVKPATLLADQDAIAAHIRQNLRTSNIETANGCRVILTAIRIVQVPSEQTVAKLDIQATYTYRERVN